jgi:hypothetical protein
VNFRTESSASLQAGAGHIRLARQSDGSYTGYEVADNPPYELGSVAPHFERRLTACNLTNAPANLYTPPEAMVRLNSGNYLYVASQPTLPGQTPTLRVLLFDAGFRFLAENDLPGGGVLALADLNGDGNPDLIVTAPVGRTTGIAVLLGAGGTNFAAPVVYAATTFIAISGTLAGDLDGDGKPDLILEAVGADNDAIGIFALYGKGDGTFEAPVVLAPAFGNQGLAIGDLNRDGIPDLVYTAGGSSTAAYVDVMPGKGGRAFGDAVAYRTGGAGAVAIGDVDGDGNPDLITNGVTVWYGDGKGGFPRRRDWFNDAPGNIILTDFDGDGRSDIVLAGGGAQVMTGDRVTVLYNRGGDFSGAPVSSVYTLSYVPGIDSADLNRDGIPDLVLSDGSAMYSLLGNGDGTFRQAAGIQTPAPGRFTLADFNGDGIPDLAAELGSAVGTNVAILPGRGDGTFASGQMVALPQPVEGFGIGDFNGDGKLDLAVLSNGPGYATNDAVTIYPGDGKGGLLTPAVYPVGPVAMAITVADFNRDGRPDIAVAAAGAYQVNNGEITILLNTGSGFVRSAVPMGADWPYSVTAADLNGDGVPDLAVQCESGRSAILLGRGDGTFRAPAFLAEKAQPGNFSVVGFAAADLNGDGRMDLVGWGGNPGIWLGNGDGTFQPQLALPRFFSPFLAVNVAGNRLPDLVVADGLTGAAVFENETLERPRRRQR